MKNILYKISILLLVIFVSCTEEVEFSSDTEALNGFSIVDGKANSYVLNSGTPDRTIELNWSASIPGVSKNPTYTVVFFKAGEETKLVSFPSDNVGVLNKLTITYATIDEALSNAGYAVGTTANLQWQVIATNGDVSVSTSKNNVTFVRFASNGIKDFNLLAPDNNKVIKADIYGDPNGEVSFSWEAAETTTGSGTIEYTILFDELDGDFSDPILSFPILSGLSFTMTHQEIGDNFASNLNVKWTVLAKIADSSIELKADAKYVNWDVFIINELYLVGDHNGWNNATATAFTNDGNGALSLQIDLLAGNNFKFLPTLGSWDGDWGKDPANLGKIIQVGEDNISVLEAGKYTITVDFSTLSYTVVAVTAPDNLYLVGDYNGWNNTTARKLYNNGAGVFSIVETFEAGKSFKFLETLGTWDGDWGESKTDVGMLEQGDEKNLTIATAGTYVVVLDFNDLTIKVAQINNLFMVGDHNGWNNGTAPQLASSSKGIFSIVENFEAGNGFKFLPTLGSWDGDWGESKTVTGMFEQDDEQNLTVENAGAYVVAVNFNTLSFTVSKITGVPTNLYLVGGFNGWSNTAGNPQFTQTSAGVFELTQTLTANDEFKFVPVAGDWGNDFGESKVSTNVLEQNDENNLKVTAGGSYKIIVNFNKGNISVVLQ